MIHAVRMAHHEQVRMWECILLTSGAAPLTAAGPLRWVPSLDGYRLIGSHRPAWCALREKGASDPCPAHAPGGEPFYEREVRTQRRTRHMHMARYRLVVMAALSALALLVLPSCSSAGTTSAPAKASTASPSMPSSQAYASKNFVVPFTITVGVSLKSPPHLDSRNLLFWDAANSSFNKVRFLVPTNLYRPGSFTSEAPPKDYLKYLQGLTSHGVQLSHVVKITVDGHPATLMTATSSPDAGFDGFFDGTLGCPNTGADQAGDSCYGIQPDLALRISVIRVGNTTLLAWARTSKANPDETFFAMFERMLESARFR